MSRILKKYIDILFYDHQDKDFLFYLSDEHLYLTIPINILLEKLSEKLKNRFGKLPNFRSHNKEALTKYKTAINVYKSDLDKAIDDEEKGYILQIIALFDYKIYLINKNLNQKTQTNTKHLRSEFNKYIKTKYPSIKIIEDKYFFGINIDLRVVKNINDYININNEIQKRTKDSDKSSILYRGHCDYTYELTPSIYRDDFIQNEHKMYRDILIRNPEEFINAKTTFEKLTIMQHYGLPTRLLDVTKNPLVALYFACEKNNLENNPAEVLIFKPDNKDIKYYDSDTVCILSNIAKCNRTLYYSSQENFNDTVEGLRLLHLIKEDKPHFSNNINTEDFDRVLVVKPVNNNNRIKRQSGYFFIFGFNQNITKHSTLDCFLKINNKILKILIDPNHMKNIKNELNNININNETLFPEIENGTQHIKEIYNYI